MAALVFALVATGSALRADIIIAEDDWESFVEIGVGTPGHAPVEIVTTRDGLQSVHFPDCAADQNHFITYRINVTQLPDDRTRFPVQLEVRNVRSDVSGQGIRNLTIDPEPNLDLQASWVAIVIRPDPFQVGAQDDRFFFPDPGDPFGVGQDLPGTIVEVPWGNVPPPCDPAADTQVPGNEPGILTTVEAQLELQLGENLIRLDPTDPRDLPSYDFESGHQLFSLIIGPDEPDLRGSVVRACGIAREIEGDRFSPGDTVTVTLEARNTAGETMIRESFPGGWTVADDGGGTVEGQDIIFTLMADGEVTYVLRSPGGECETLLLSGTFAGAGDCEGEVAGEAELGCLGSGGIEISGEDWESFVEIGAEPGALVPEIVLTRDDRLSLHFQQENLDKFALYAVDVTSLPAERTRFPVAVEARQVADHTNGLTIRNLTLDPEPDPSLQASFISILMNDSGVDGGPPRARDDRDPFTDVDPPGTIGRSGPLVQDPTLDTTANPTGVQLTRNATLELTEGVNFLKIDASDPRDLPSFAPDTGWQAFSIRIGPNEPDLQGTVVAACSVRRSLPSFFLPGETIDVTLEANNISGETTVVETFTEGLEVADAGGGTVEDHRITFTLDAPGEISYSLSAPPDFCEPVEISGTFAGPGVACEGDVFGKTTSACASGCQDPSLSGGVPAMLIIGPIDLGADTGPSCDDFGRLGVTDYLTDGVTDETNVEPVFGDELRPAFGDEAGGFGVKFSPNPEINPRADEGVLTVWIADADDEGRIDFNDADNIGNPVDFYLVYSLVYLENTTGEPLAVILEVGSDDAVKVLLNGEQVHINAVCRGIPAAGAGDRVPVTLEPGRNTVLIAVIEQGGGTGVRLIVRDDFDLPLTDGSVIACLSPGTEPPPPVTFVRGDANSDGSINLTDGVALLSHLFQGTEVPQCRDAADADDNGSMQLTDAIVTFQFLFLGEAPPREPSPPRGRPYELQDCGEDPTEDGLDCAGQAVICAP